MNAPCLFLRRLGVDDLGPPPKRSLREIAREVARRHGLTVDDLRGPSKRRIYSHPRQEAMAISYATGRWSNEKISAFYGGRDHTSCNWARKRHAERVAAEALGIAS